MAEDSGKGDGLKVSSEVRWSARAMVPTAGGIEVGSCEAIKDRGKVLVGWPRRLRGLVGEEMPQVAHWWGRGRDLL
jgi:hypothetical protein